VGSIPRAGTFVEIAFVLAEYDPARLPPAEALMALPIKLDHSVIHVSDWERDRYIELF